MDKLDRLLLLHIHRNQSKVRTAASHPFKSALLEYSQQCNLSLSGELPDFIEENRAGVRQLKTALSLLEGARKCPLLVAEQFEGAFDPRPSALLPT